MMSTLKDKNQDENSTILKSAVLDFDESPSVDFPSVDFNTSPILIGKTKFEILPGVKNIMITGGAGFIASYVVRHFTIQYPEYNIISYDKLDYCSSTNNTLCLDNMPNFTFEKGDITGMF